jgi:predicted DNA-binding ribbon-helix-helix protein
MSIIPDKSMRALTRHGHRLGVRLEPETWAAIDLIAKNRKLKWQKWAEQVLDAAGHSFSSAGMPSATGILRAAAIQELQNEMVRVAQSREFLPPADLHHAYLEQVTPVMLDVMKEELANSEVVYSCDFGSFVLHAGTRNQGGPALFIENKMIDELSLIISKDE